MSNARNIADGTRYVDAAGDTMSGTLVVPGMEHSSWNARLDRTWDNFPSITVLNDTTDGPQGEFRIHGLNGVSGGDYSINLRVDGKLLTGIQTNTSVVSDASVITVNTTATTAIASVSITTVGKPVLLIATGDQNPNQSGGWHWMAFTINGTEIGKAIINENAGGISKNCPFALTHIHQPPAGTWTFAITARQGSGSMTYGESGNVQAPTIIAVELV